MFFNWKEPLDYGNMKQLKNFGVFREKIRGYEAELKKAAKIAGIQILPARSQHEKVSIRFRT